MAAAWVEASSKNKHTLGLPKPQKNSTSVVATENPLLRTIGIHGQQRKTEDAQGLSSGFISSRSRRGSDSSVLCDELGQRRLVLGSMASCSSQRSYYSAASEFSSLSQNSRAATPSFKAMQKESSTQTQPLSSGSGVLPQEEVTRVGPNLTAHKQERKWTGVIPAQSSSILDVSNPLARASPLLAKPEQGLKTDCSNPLSQAEAEDESRRDMDEMRRGLLYDENGQRRRMSFFSRQ